MASSANPRRSADTLDAQIPGAFPPSLRSHSQASVPISTQQASLTQILYDRRAEYTRSKSVRIKVGTWNVAAQKGTEHDVGAWFVHGKGVEEALAGLGVHDDGHNNDRESVSAQEARRASYTPTVPHHDTAAVAADDAVGLYVLGLQEIVDVGSPTEALRPFTDPSAAKRWKSSIEAVLPKGYQMVAEQQLIGLWLIIYASPEVRPHVKNVSTTSVGTGLMGYMGNKGAVTARIVLGETTRLVFVNSHLAAGADKASLERRNWDAAQIVSRTRFDPITDALGTTQDQGEGLGDEEFAFWFGDLNYRLEGMAGDDVRKLLTIHTEKLDAQKERLSSSNDSAYESKASSQGSEDSVPLPPELDPASLQTTISSLLPHDELHQQMKAGKAFHDGWQEGPIRFLPTYKYDVGKVGVFDSSEKRRCPSWCDRILYRTRAAKKGYDAKVKEKEAARKRDEQMKAAGTDKPHDEDVLYDYDPDTDGDTNEGYDEYDEQDDPVPQAIETRDGLSDEILLESYTVHSRVLSSDHKPLDAVFSLSFDAVVPELKTAIHTEVARELDRQENEGRPSIAVVVDRAAGESATDDKDKTDSTFDGVDFGDVKFAKSKRRNITIANTGRVPATFGFADRPVDAEEAPGPFPSWLSVAFDRDPDPDSKIGSDDVHQRFTLAPADVLNAELKIKIDDLSTVRTLNTSSSSAPTNTLDSILVLRVEQGRDHFLPLRAHWQPSALARGIDALIKIPEGGIRKLQGQIPDRAEVKWSTPRELFRLTEATENMTERAIAEWGMIASAGERAPWWDNAAWPFVNASAKTEVTKSNPVAYGEMHEDVTHENELGDLFDALDTDTSFSQCFSPATLPHIRAELLASVLLTFLTSLTDGIIPAFLTTQLATGLAASEKSKPRKSDDEVKMWALEIMASQPAHSASFLLVISFLTNLAGQIADVVRAEPEVGLGVSTKSNDGTSNARNSIETKRSNRRSAELPASPRVAVRRRTLSKVPRVAARQLVVRNYAVVFSQVVFRFAGEGKEAGKERERVEKLFESFLNVGDE